MTVNLSTSCRCVFRHMGGPFGGTIWPRPLEEVAAALAKHKESGSLDRYPRALTATRTKSGVRSQEAQEIPACLSLLPWRPRQASNTEVPTARIIADHRGLCGRGIGYSLRREKPSPARPRPRRASVAGSGTGSGTDSNRTLMPS
jgi:hypothetical protein